MRLNWIRRRRKLNRQERGFGFDFAALIFAGDMARKPLNLSQIEESGPALDRDRIAATTEADIRRHQIEDDQDPDAPLPPFRPAPNVRAIRMQLRITQEEFASAIAVPVATIRNWEQSRITLDPAVGSLLRVLDREPEIVLKALAG